MTTTPTQKQKPVISGHTFMFGKAMAHVQNATTYLMLLVADEHPSGKTKRMFNEWLRMLKRIKQDAYNSLTLENRQIMETELMSDDLTLQIDAINDMILALPPAKRTEIEKYVELQYDIYKQTQ